MKQDYWFEPGDKVMRVCFAQDLGFSSGLPLTPETDFGRILCVDHCEALTNSNRVWFVGIVGKGGYGWVTSCFRKVDEIRLCVKAAQKVGEPVELEPNFSGA